ncbi:MAG: M42 family metallopeptidase [Candidatus Zixiibacteriota bacterium]
MDQTEVLLQELTDAYGVSGYEGDARDVMARYMKKLTTLEYDHLGSLIGTKKGTAESPRVALVGHMDEIGFMVKEITKEGYIKFLPLGGWWGHVALGQRVQIMTDSGPVVGVIGSTPPHLLKAKEREKVLEIDDMFIDVGVMENYDITKKLGVKVGDPIIPDSKFTIMNHNKMYLAKAFDNRVACAMVIEVLKNFQKTKHPNTILGIGTVQEEVGLRGARTAAFQSEPDVAIILDVSVARDIPPENFDRAEKFGGGPGILVYDGSMIPNQRLRKLAIKTAEENKITFHLTALQRGGTDGGAFHIARTGVPSIFICIETRYIHSHNSIIYRKDYDNVVKLATALAKKLDKKTVESLTKV